MLFLNKNPLAVCFLYKFWKGFEMFNKNLSFLNNEELTERYPDIKFINAFVYSDKEALNAMESGLI